MTLAKWLAAALFFFGAVGAWHAAQPKSRPANKPPRADGSPLHDAISAESATPKRMILTPPEPIKFMNSNSN